MKDGQSRWPCEDTSRLENVKTPPPLPIFIKSCLMLEKRNVIALMIDKHSGNAVWVERCNILYIYNKIKCDELQ